jgi:hypothetical protein
VTANESETSTIQPTASGGAEEELWLTYLNYDQSVGQAVRRLGALSTENVDLFRSLLLKSRDRSKVKDYEAESIRRLQGDAFVGDEELQRTLIVLTAEEPRFGEELKRLVAATGRPAQLDQVVAAIRSGKTSPVKPAEAGAKDQVRSATEEHTKAPAPEPAKEAAPKAAPKPVSKPAPKPAKESAKQPIEAVVVPLRKEQAPPQPILGEAIRREIRSEESAPKEKRNLKPLAIIAAVVLVAAVGLVVMVPGLIGGKKAPESRVAAAPPVAQPTEAPVAAPAPAAQHAPAPAVDIAMPAQADRNAASSPPLRPASAQPDAPADAPPQSDTRPAPVAGSQYKVVKGDMLSDIAFQVYRDASKFRLIQSANPGIRNKDRILVDQVIFIPPDSRPVSR